jgi:drug/metabolite transporter (DMT)-like permease
VTAVSRSGDEPAHARSPLRLRLGLALFGAACGVAGVVLFAVTGHAPLAVVFAVLGVVAVADAAVVARHIREGPHYQPGPDVPPYRPMDPERPARREPRQVPASTRMREYLLLMGTCLGLLLVAWVGLRPVSTAAAVAVTLVAMVIPPAAAIVANRQRR